MHEEAIGTLRTPQDFTQVFDSRAQLEERMTAAKMETPSELRRGEEDEMSWDCAWPALSS